VNEGMFKEIEQLLGTRDAFQKATKTEAKTAMTSKLAWNVAKELKIKPLIWESIMFHPHKEGNSLTNRKPTETELLKYKHILLNVFDIIDPETVVAVGRTAENSLKIMGISANYVRHPAQGGYKKFREGMKKLQT
jgi:uracil-DNA glycosylase